eukprot:10136661-Lingulodinium_polyedra.AAC.1
MLLLSACAFAPGSLPAKPLRMGAAKRCTASPGGADGESRSERGSGTSGSRGVGCVQGGLSGDYCGAEESTRPGTCC